MNTNGTGAAPPIERFRTLLHEERFDVALKEMKAWLPAHPRNARLIKLIGVAHLLSGNAAGAVPYFRQCVELSPSNGEARFDLGVAYEAADQLKKASEAFAAAVGVQPDYADAHNNLGLICGKVGRLPEAVRHLKLAVELNPASAVFHSNLATIQKQTGDFDEAKEHFEEAIRLDPTFVQAYGNYGDMLQFQNRLAEVEPLLKRASKFCDPATPSLLDLRAHLATDRKQFEDARRFLRQAIDADPSPMLRHRRLSLLGKTNDRLGDYDTAFANFTDANRYAARFARDRGIDPKIYANQIDGLIAQLETLEAAVPKAATEEGDANAPAFLVGFPRSGTTLMDTILRSHPDIDVLEELPIVTQLRLSLGQGPASLAVQDFPDDERSALQAAYFDKAKSNVGKDGARVLIDKFPLNLVEAGFIRSVFPNAKFILALRHPNDCVLSCFMQTFDLNNAMANFLDLDDTARLYDRTMTLWRLYEEKLNLQVHAIRYEDIVGDLRGAVAPLIEFLGLDWHDNVENYRETALGREHINTPSYNQVIQPVYRHAMGRWTNYETQLSRTAPLLKPWEQHWGYS